MKQRRLQHQTGSFLVGMAWGVVIGLSVLLLPVVWHGTGNQGLILHPAPSLQQAWQMVETNLRGSVIPFAVVLLAFVLQLLRLRSLLAGEQPELDRVVRHEQLLDLSANLFFGVGVIWTAVGMRGALMHGLGDPGGATSAGAFEVLKRLVEGGILLALSTTIVGGIGGYLMRVVKSVTLGRSLAGLYMRESQRPAEANLAALARIERLLQGAQPESVSKQTPA